MLGKTRGGWRRGTQGLKRAGAKPFEWRIIADAGAVLVLPCSIEKPDWHAALEFVAANRRAFGRSTRFEVVGGSPTRVAFAFTAENVDRWAAHRAGREYVAPSGVAEIPQRVGFDDVGAAHVGIDSPAAGVLATSAPWEA